MVQANLEGERNDCRKACKSYLAIKLVNIFIVIAQTLLINFLLGIDIYSFGYRKINSYVNFFRQQLNSNQNEDDLESSYYHINSPYFPLKSVCVFRIRELASTNSYAVVCSLPINLFIQFSFFILLIWYLVLVIFNIIYAIKWCLRFKRCNQIEYIRNKLTNRLRHISRRSKSSNASSSCFALAHLDDFEYDNVSLSKTMCRECDFFFNLFFDSFLTSDLVFFLRIVSLSSSERLVESVLVYFWKIFVDSIQMKKEAIKDQIRKSS